MDLLLVYAGLSLTFSAAAVWLAAAGSALAKQRTYEERPTFWLLSGPTMAGAVVLAFLTGWALREPEPADERITFSVCSVACVASLVLVRTLLRAVRSLVLARELQSVATLGLFRCRVVVSAEFGHAASPEVLAAALAHERAHARNRDPLRIWLAQMVCDLQWPFPNATRRFERWLLALEMRRDDEAVAAGASPIALAESILLAAKLHGCARARAASAAITGCGAGLALRVRRLLEADTLPIAHPARHSMAWLLLAAMLIAAGTLGANLGEVLLPILPGVVR